MGGSTLQKKILEGREIVDSRRTAKSQERREARLADMARPSPNNRSGSQGVCSALWPLFSQWPCYLLSHSPLVIRSANHDRENSQTLI